MKHAKCAKIFTICSAHPNTAASDSSSKSKQLHFQLIAIDRSPPRFLRSNRSVQNPPTIGSKTSFDRYCLQIAKLHPAAAAAAADSKQKCIKHLTRFGRRRHGARVESGSSSFGCRSDPDPVPSNRPKKTRVPSRTRVRDAVQRCLESRRGYLIRLNRFPCPLLGSFFPTTTVWKRPQRNEPV